MSLPSPSEHKALEKIFKPMENGICHPYLKEGRQEAGHDLSSSFSGQYRQ